MRVTCRNAGGRGSCRKTGTGGITWSISPGRFARRSAIGICRCPKRMPPPFSGRSRATGSSTESERTSRRSSHNSTTGFGKGTFTNAVPSLPLWTNCANAGNCTNPRGRCTLSESHGDEKDRVLVRADGRATYFASDLAYHREKFHRKFTKVIDIWGADHHGYAPRLVAALRGLGEDDSRLEILLVQFVTLIREG